MEQQEVSVSNNNNNNNFNFNSSNINLEALEKSIHQVFFQEHNQWLDGVSLIRACKYNEAKEFFKLLLKQTPNSLYFRLGLAEVELFWAHLNFSKEYLEEALSKVKDVEMWANTLLQQNKEETILDSFFKFALWNSNVNNTNSNKNNENKDNQKLIKKRICIEANLALAEMYGALATLKFKNAEYIKGIYFIRKSWKMYEELSKESLSYFETYLASVLRGRIAFGLGVYHFVISLIPHSFIWMVEAIGFKADRELGLKELEESKKVINSGRSDDASFVLSFSYWFILERQIEAEQIINELIAKYKDSVNYLLARALMYRRDGKIQASLQDYEKCTQIAEMPQQKLIAEYEMGHCYWLLCDWEKCAPACEKYIKMTTTNQFRPFGAFKLGFCLWMLNKREGIKEIYQQIPTWVRPNVAYDRYAQVHSANFLKNGCFTPFEEKFFPLMNLIESKDFNGAKTKLEELKDFFLTYNSGYETFQDLQAKLLFVEGKILHALHCNLEAKQILEKVLSLESSLQEDKWCIPHSLLELGEIYQEEKDFEKAVEFFTKCKHYPAGYDFDRLIQLQVQRGMQKAQNQEKKV